MFNDICFYVKGNMIEVNGQEFLLGEPSAVSYTHLTLPTNREV